MSRQPVTVPCKYKTGRVLGNGTYATVKGNIIDTGKYYACKIINKKLMEGREHMIRNEINILKRISQGNKNILSLVDYFETVNNLYLVTDLASGGELFDRICEKGSYFEKDAAKIVQTICSAVAYLHDNGIAPEIFKKTGHGKPVDLWAIGVITYFLLSGYTPFEGSNNVEEMQAIMNADYNYDDPCWENISQAAKNFIDRCLTINADERITAHQALEHEWLLTISDGSKSTEEGGDLLPNLRTNFNARRTFKKAINMVTLSNHFGHSLKSSSSSTSNENNIQPVNEGIDQVLETA
ncbi:kinase-like domain-containing protein [Mucor lusitanicus]|uniref:Kinase-like domain-containing protein n=1 Tax=Mucor circinelloides f. lusitanicus TaxID=29924 RepID=A0A8H4EZ13_MUCCL|nr:kinase-like domain-containing protein [Mucor lusitanicus]